jgi:hypothetical protein
MDDVDLLHRLHTDLDHLVERNVWQNPKGREFKERTRDQLLRGYQQKHEKALETFEESHGLPLTAEEYARWHSLLSARDGELYYDVYAYHRLKPLHAQVNVAVFEDALEKLNDNSLQRRRPLLIDGYLAYLETWLYEQRRAGRSLQWSEYFENMRTWVGRAQMPELTVIWLERVRILETYCFEDLEGLNDAVENIGMIGQPSSRASWLKFRYRQTKRLAERAEEELLAAILNRLSNFDRDLNNPNDSPTPDELAHALEYALMAANMVTNQHPAHQIIQRVLGRCTHSAQLAAIKQYFENKRQAYLGELATKPVKEMLGKFEELNSQVGRIHRALGRFRRHADQAAEFNPILFQEIAEGLPNQEPNRSVRHIAELLREVAKGVEELREQYIKLLRTSGEVSGRETWSFPELRNEVPIARDELVRIAARDVVFYEINVVFYEIKLFGDLRDALKAHFGRIEEAVKALRDALIPERRQEESPLRLYREARRQLDSINVEADAVRGLRGYERLLDVSIFRVPNAFVRSNPRVTLDRFYNQLEGLEEHERIVDQLIKRAEQWDNWRQRLLRAYDEGFAVEANIEGWSNYVNDLLSRLPVTSLSELDEGLYGSTADWLNAIQDVDWRPLVDIVELRKVLTRDVASKLPQVLANVFSAAPSRALPDDLAHYYGSYAGRLGDQRTLGDLVERDLSELDANDILEEVERRLQERAEALAEKCQALNDYLAGVQRIIEYLEDAKKGVVVALSDERARRNPNRNLIRDLESDLKYYNEKLSILNGTQQQGNTQ